VTRVAQIAGPGATRGPAHHDVLQCRSCGRTAEVERVGPVEPCPDPAHAAGFVVDGVEVVFHGLCPHCRPAR
jgi:Fur family ferric uptake transcriptional regulator